MSEFTRPAQETLEAAREYADSKADELKLQVAKGLSESVTKIITILVLVLVASTLLLVLSFGLILLLGQLMGGKYAIAALLVAAVIGIILALLIVFRDKLFRNTFVPVFVKLFFPLDDDKTGEEPEVPGDPDSGEPGR